jgi:serine/threonine-protein kinase
VFTVREAIRYARETLAALSAAHELGIVHRDIKPQNLMLHELPDGSKHIKVLDFGLARVIPGISLRAPQPLNVPTDTGVVFGTPRFVSPEAALGQHVDHRADIYGVGLVLYVMLARRGPFDHASGHVAVMTAHLTEEPEPPSKYSPVPVPLELDAIVLKALDKDKDARIQTVQEFETLLASMAKASLSGRVSSIRVAATAVGTASNEQAEPANEADSGLELPITGDIDGNPERIGRSFYVGLTLFAALLVFIIGYLILVKRGVP